MRGIVYPTRTGRWRWRLETAAGRVVACSATNYTRVWTARRGFQRAMVGAGAHDWSKVTWANIED